MGDFPRKADGRRIFTVEFKRGVVQQILKDEKTLAEVARELDIQPAVLREWKRRFEAGATAAVRANEDVVPASALREAQQRIRELERLLVKKQMEIEILQAAQEVVKKVPGCAKGPGGDRAPRGRHLPDPGHGAADGLSPAPGSPGRVLPPGRGCDRARADSCGDEQPGHVRVPPGVGDGEPSVPDPVQPQTDPPGHAPARPHAGHASAPAPRAAPSGAGAAAGLQPALVLGRVPHPLLEWGGCVGGLRDRLP